MRRRRDSHEHDRIGGVSLLPVFFGLGGRLRALLAVALTPHRSVRRTGTAMNAMRFCIACTAAALMITAVLELRLTARFAIVLATLVVRTPLGRFDRT
jgi:hypothetical protein